MASGDPVERQVRAAQNQSLFRGVNERLEGLADAFQYIAGTNAAFACECADLTCIQTMSLSVSEYEAVRASPNRFAVLPGHVYPGVETVVSQNERFVVVEKIGAAGRVAAQRDPRVTN